MDLSGRDLAPPSYEEATGLTTGPKLDGRLPPPYYDTFQTVTPSLNESSSSGRSPLPPPPPPIEVPPAETSSRRPPAEETNQWAHGLFDCRVDSEIFWMQLCCPCYAERGLAKQAGLTRLADSLTITSAVGLSVLGLWLLVFALIETSVLQARSLEDEDYREYHNDYFETEKSDYLIEFEMFGVKMVVIVLCSLKIVRFFLALQLRLHIRTSYTVSAAGDSNFCLCMADAVSVCFCYDCTICQEKATLDIYDREHGFFGTNDLVERS